MIRAIACIGKNRELGKNNDLIFHLKKDMKVFVNYTRGAVVAMGWNTFKSLGEKPLKDRTNLVLAPENIERDDCIIVHSLEAMLFLLNKYSSIGGINVYIIGGGWFYTQCLPYCDELLLTEVDAEDQEATVFFPEFKEYFNLVETNLEEEGGVRLSFNKYVRRQ